MKMKSMAAIALSGFVAIALSMPVFADGTSSDNTQSADQSAFGTNNNDSKNVDSGSTDMNTANKTGGDEGSQDTATGDDDY